MNYFFLLPSIAYAQYGSLPPLSNPNALVQRLASIGSVAVYLLIALAVVYIVYAIVMYFIKGEEGDENRKKAGMRILWGIVGLAIIVSLWGIVNLLINTFWTNNTVPAFPNADFINKPTGSSGSATYDPYHGRPNNPYGPN